MVTVDSGSFNGASYARGVTTSLPPEPPRLVVGFDLDMTLIDTVPGFAATLVVLGEELGVEFPVAEMT